MDWKAAIKESVKVSEQQQAKKNEALAEEDAREKMLRGQLNKAMFDLRAGANEFVREAKANEVEASVKTIDHGFEVTAKIQNTRVRIAVIGDVVVQKSGYLFYCAEINGTEYGSPHLPSAQFKRHDESAIPELMAELLLQAVS